jgi:hypothetical protein
VISRAAPEDKAELYKQLGLRLTYHSGRKAVFVEARPEDPVCVRYVSEGI